MRSWKAEKELFKEYMIESFKGHRVGDQVHQIDDDTFEWFWYHLDKLKDGEPEKKLMDKLGDFPKAGFNRINAVLPIENQRDIYGIVSTSKPYDTAEVIKRLVDNSEFDEYKEDYGQSIMCAYARIDGWAVGIVANQRKLTKSKKGELQFGGVIYSDSADKAARFIMLCNQKKIPLVFYKMLPDLW